MVVGAVGDNKLMPPPDTACLVINAESGYVRNNSSWLLSRVVRDYDDWKHENVTKHLKSMLDKRDTVDRNQANAKEPGSGATLRYPTRTGLGVAVYKAEEARAGVPGHDLVYWLGFGTCILQLGIAVTPCGIYGDWAILQITVVGMLLSFLTGSLPQWKREKWACRNKCNRDVILTKGNGSQHAILILGQGKGFDLEDLAAGQIDTDLLPKKATSFILQVLTVLWICLLITAAGIKQNTWFLLAIGAVGSAQNVFAAGKKRTPAAYGMSLTLVEVVGLPKVMDTLFEVEKRYPSAGSSMVNTFFPGGKLTENEKMQWHDLEKSAKERREAGKLQQSKSTK